MKTKITLLILLVLFVISVNAQKKMPETTFETGTVADYDGNNYITVKIGNQWWLAENLRTTHYYDGTAIPLFTKSATVSGDDYKDYYTYPNNDAANVSTYGLLYSWSVICDQTATTFKQLLPTGWAVADTTDWAELATYLGGKSIAGGKLKSTTNWTSPNTGATNEVGFDALPSGDCNTGGYTVFGTEARYWTPRLVMAGGAGRVYMTLSNASAAMSKGQYRNVNALSIRLVKSVTTAVEPAISENSICLWADTDGNRLVLKNCEKNSVLKIRSLNGALLKTIILNEGDNMFEYRDFPKGMYLATIQNSLKSTTIKYLKIK